jgi:hypothetical protein
MANDLVVVNRRRYTAATVISSDLDDAQQDIDRIKSRIGWVMVPGLNYMRAIENTVVDQFDRMSSSLMSKRIKVHEHLLDMVQMAEVMIIKDIQIAAYRWAREEAEWQPHSASKVITRDYAANEVLKITKGHFGVIHREISGFGLVDFKDRVQLLIVLELQNLERYLNWYLCTLISGWE